MSDVITALIIAPTIVLIDDIDKFKIFKALLYPHIINNGNTIIIGTSINKAGNEVCFFTGEYESFSVNSY